MKRILALIALSVAAAPAPLSAFPDGAPWGSADPASAQNCAACHFDGEVITDSASVSLFFEGTEIHSGEALDVYVQFRNPKNKEVGFQIITTAGEFSSSYEDIEAKEKQARSNALRDNSSWAEIIGTGISTNATIWQLKWIPPETPGEDVYFWIAVNESNSDQSAFGDQIHFKTIKANTAGGFRLLPAL